MKKILPLLVLLFAAGAWSGNASMAQANVTLSNLTTTAVNADLIPGTTGTRLLGNSGKGWKQLFVTDAVYLNGSRFLSFGSNATLGVSAVGFKTLAVNTGAANTGFGFSALAANTKGDHNTAIGNSSLLSNTTGRNNVAAGSSSLYNNTTGVENVAVGHGAMLINTAGNSNTSVGAFALQSNASGYGNIAIGSHALNKNNTGWSNVAIGDSALQNQSGVMRQNVAIGTQAMRDLNTYSYNTAVGSYAFSGGGGEGNVAIGWGALTSALDENTAVGFDAGMGGGLNSTFIGSHASGGGSVVNSTAIGAYSSVGGSNEVRVGNGATTSIGGAVSWSVVSDARFKKNIKANVPGLDFIRQLRPVTYNYDPAAMRRFTDRAKGAATAEESSNRNALNALTQAEEEKSKVVFTGFVAQEVGSGCAKNEF